MKLKISKGMLIRKKSDSSSQNWFEVQIADAYRVYARNIYNPENIILLSRKHVYIPTIVHITVSDETIKNLINNKTTVLVHNSSPKWDKLKEYPDLVIFHDSNGLWKVYCTISGISQCRCGNLRRIKVVVNRFQEFRKQQE